MEKEELVRRYVIQVVSKGVVEAVWVEWKAGTSRAGKSALHTPTLDPP